MEEGYYEEYEDQLEDQEDYADVPYQKKKDDLFSLFTKVWKAPDSSKVGNLNNQELGVLNISVRDAQRIALLAEVCHHKKFGEFFNKQAEIILKTSASKKGWFVELFVSQKKFTSRSSSQTTNLPEKKSKWNLYNKKNQTPQYQV